MSRHHVLVVGSIILAFLVIGGLIGYLLPVGSSSKSKTETESSKLMNPVTSSTSTSTTTAKATTTTTGVKPASSKSAAAPKTTITVPVITLPPGYQACQDYGVGCFHPESEGMSEENATATSLVDNGTAENACSPDGCVAS